MPLTQEQSIKLTKWYAVNANMKALKEEESTLRLELVAELFTKEKESGSESIKIDNGFQLKVTKKLDYKLDNKNDQVIAVSALINPDLAKQLIRWKPELSVTAYNNLDRETQDLFNGCLTIKPGMPTLEVVAPKVK